MRFFATFQCPECGRSMTKTDFNFSLDAQREGRCAPCSWARNDRLHEQRYDDHELTLAA